VEATVVAEVAREVSTDPALAEVAVVDPAPKVARTVPKLKADVDAEIEIEVVTVPEERAVEEVLVPDMTAPTRLKALKELMELPLTTDVARRPNMDIRESPVSNGIPWTVSPELVLAKRIRERAVTEPVALERTRTHLLSKARSPRKKRTLLRERRRKKSPKPLLKKRRLRSQRRQTKRLSPALTSLTGKPRESWRRRLVSLP